MMNAPPTPPSAKMGAEYTAFFYGTLMSEPILHRVLWGTSKPTQSQKAQLTIVPAILHAYCRHKVMSCDYPGIVAQDGKSVLGTYVTGLKDEDMRHLDRFEGNQYRRDHVKVRLLEEADPTMTGGERKEGREVDTQTYVFLYEGFLMDEEWSYEEFVRDKIQRWVLTSEEYEEVDSASEETGQDPTGGRGINK